VGAAPYVEHGTFLEVDSPRRLVMTETLEGMWSETTVTVVLEEEDGKTRFVLVHENLPASRRDGAADGWPGFIDRIERLVTVTPR
jgi:uncharacterized protein YndB with AHSA1/START domain